MKKPRLRRKLRIQWHHVAGVIAGAVLAWYPHPAGTPTDPPPPASNVCQEATS